jgi:SpoVK/Ycf46/Vps4 family AAA+-type ATPase
VLLQVVNGPEVLSKYVGQAEENIRNLFGEAEAEYKEKGDASVSLEGESAHPVCVLVHALPGCTAESPHDTVLCCQRRQQLPAY